MAGCSLLTELQGTNANLDDTTLGTRFNATFTPGKKHLIRFINTSVDTCVAPPAWMPVIAVLTADLQFLPSLARLAQHDGYPGACGQVRLCIVLTGEPE